MKRFDSLPKIAISLLALGALLAVSGYLMGGWNQLKEVTSQYRQQTNVSFSDVTSIDINANISILPSDDDQFHLYYYRNQHHQTDLTNYQLTDGKLVIKDQGQDVSESLFDQFFSFYHQTPDTSYQPVLYVPKGRQLDKLSGLINGDVHLKKLQIDLLDLSIQKGKTVIEDSQIDSIALSILDGDLVLEDTRLDSQTTSESQFISTIYLTLGQLTANNLTLAGHHDIMVLKGDTHIQLKEDSKQTLHVEAYSESGQVILPQTQTQTQSQTQLILFSKQGDILVE
ncbi:TPA: DUF4097 family beta strand repeat-containing protein [Streptococcus suis]